MPKTKQDITLKEAKELIKRLGNLIKEEVDIVKYDSQRIDILEEEMEDVRKRVGKLESLLSDSKTKEEGL